MLRRNDAEIPFALIYPLNDGGSEATLAETIRLPGGLDASPAVVRLGGSEDRWHFSEVIQTRLGLVLDDLGSRFGTLPGGRWPASPRSALILPLRAPGRAQLAGILVGGVSPYRALDDDYRRFYELVAAHIATSILNARAYREAEKRAEMLAELDHAKTTFFSNVSHEFRTPLTLLLGPVEEMLGKPDDSPLGLSRQLLALVHRNGLRLKRLVNTLLDFSRIEAGRMQASYVPTDLSAFTAELASSFRSAMERAGLNYDVETPALSEPVYLDGQMWEKVVLNLISNAFKYTLQGSVSVRVKEIDGHVDLLVSDTGVGIPERELPRLFERFHRVESVRGRTHEGTGIGLALVNELVKLHGGTVSVESVAGNGTTFRVSIPFGSSHLPADRIGAERVAAETGLPADTYVEEALRWLAPPANAAVSEPDYASDSAFRSGTRSHVLIADDNADMRDYLRRLLESRYQVTAVSNGSEAFDAAIAKPPDLVLTDVMMPVLDGFELLKRLRAEERTKTLPIILLSARAGEESRVEGLDGGADDYLAKPFTARELLARVDAHLSLARMRRQVNEARQVSEARLGLVLQSTNMVAWEWDPVEDVLTCTGDFKRVFGTTLSSWREGFSLVHPDDVVRHRAAVEGAARDGGSYCSEFRIHRADTGELAWLEERATAITDENGRPTRLVGVVMDITERKIAEEDMRRHNTDLQRANSELEEFAYAASHDLQEPLRTVNIYTELLLRKSHLLADPRSKEYATYVHEGVRRMQLLIQDLLQYARVVHHEQEPPGAVGLEGAIAEAVSTLRGLVMETGAKIHREHVSGKVLGEHRQIVQVFQNLFSNSLKYRREGVVPQVRIAAERRGAEWLVTVSDNGIGFDPQYAERIFGLFRRLHKTEFPGTGLGLAICRRIVERYGGRMWALSEGDGKGATFQIALKAVE
ncbi:MAG: response regulator [Acidobacteriaceae bacterium]|nr:response regulator [Acidobacteriaceae bacterium]